MHKIFLVESDYCLNLKNQFLEKQSEKGVSVDTIAERCMNQIKTLQNDNGMELNGKCLVVCEHHTLSDINASLNLP